MRSSSWYASTCRHLGIGGKHPDPAVWEAHKRAMRDYLRLKRFYTQGVFYGVDETVHAHTLPDEGKSVLNVFNLADIEVEREIRFRLSEVGLGPGPVGVLVGAGPRLPAVAATGVGAQVGACPHTQDGDLVTLDLRMPARSQALVQVERAES